MIGGLTDVKPKDDIVDELVESIKEDFETKNYTTNCFDADSYKTQVVNGVNYFIKIKTDREYIHLRLHKALPHNNSEVSYHSHQSSKNKEDEIIHF